MPTPDTKMAVALLSQAGEAGRHLREALVGSGAPIVYEAQAAELDRDALEKSGARVVVVNLDTEVEAHLDEVYSLLGDDRYNVIFNEAQVSSQLSGWEQARWARHLAAKILGAENADPPRPEGAEPVPQRAPVERTAEKPAEQPTVSVMPVAQAQPEARPQEDVAPSESGPADADDDFSDIARLLAEPDPEPMVSGGPRASESEDSQETVQMPVLDLSEFDDVADAGTGSSVEVNEDEDDFAIDPEATREMPAFDLPIESESENATAEALGFGDLDDFAEGGTELEFDLGSETEELPAATENHVDDELAGEIEAGEAAATGASASELEMLDLDWADEPQAESTDQNKEPVEAAPPPAIGSAFAWSLEDIDEAPAASGTQKEEKPAEASEFGIETISASEYLAPDAAPAEESAFDGGLSLELIPLEEAVAPQAAGHAGAEHQSRESWLDTSTKVAISRVWVLGASIGGPEAVREFLGQMPAKFPALFLLAQHMGAEFMEIMSQQLARSTPLTVRTPQHGERVGHGDIVVVPTSHRLRVDREGVITLESINASEQPNSPSIDQVVSDVADRFGSRAGVIVFSGMADDAAEGCAHLAAKGGKVYVQDPNTCVISSMVDGVIETGVVAFTGSPKALAEKVLADTKAA